jgi:hypothetical protein
MNNISPHLKDFDFCWSSCCFEHLGNLDKGIEFVINSVEQTLKVGGIACHTTEFNLSSNEDTVEEGETVIYRKKDIEKLISILQDRGHKVSTIKIAKDLYPADFYVDLPPYNNSTDFFYVDIPPYKCSPHLKLQLSDYVATSIGLVIERGK